MRETATPFMFLLAGFALLLSRAASRREVMVGVNLSGRTRPETEGLIGHFINMLLIRADVSGNPRFLELLRRVRNASLEAIHQELPYDKLVEELKPERTSDGSSLLQVVFNFSSSRRNGVGRLLDASGLRLRAVEPADRLVRFDLMLMINEAEGAYSGAWIYSAELFEPATIASLHERFMALLGRIVERPEATLSEMAVQATPESERRQEGARLELNRQRLRTVEPKPVRI
jgi:non-ribosomal peptide synthetase component F